MKILTKVFGEIEIDEDKVITFPRGIIGFPQLLRFTLLFDEEKGTDAGIRWLQSLDEPAFAMPVMDPLVVKPDYNPVVDEELLEGVGDSFSEAFLVLVTVSVPSDLKKMSVNLQGPIIINAGTRKACQIIVDADKFPVKFPIYDILHTGKERD